MPTATWKPPLLSLLCFSLLTSSMCGQDKISLSPQSPPFSRLSIALSYGKANLNPDLRTIYPKGEKKRFNINQKNRGLELSLRYRLNSLCFLSFDHAKLGKNKIGGLIRSVEEAQNGEFSGYFAYQGTYYSFWITGLFYEPNFLIRGSLTLDYQSQGIALGLAQTLGKNAYLTIKTGLQAWTRKAHIWGTIYQGEKLPINNPIKFAQEDDFEDEAIDPYYALTLGLALNKRLDLNTNFTRYHLGNERATLLSLGLNFRF